MMNKQELIEILKKLLDTDTELDFLCRLEEDELQKLVACVRSRVDEGV